MCQGYAKLPSLVLLILAVQEALQKCEALESLLADERMRLMSRVEEACAAQGRILYLVGVSLLGILYRVEMGRVISIEASDNFKRKKAEDEEVIHI